MNAEVHCSQALLNQADFDGELDATQSASIEAHRAKCELCSRAYEQLRTSRELLRSVPGFTAPDSLRKKVIATARPAGARKIGYATAGAGVGAVAAGLLVFLLLGTPRSYVAESIVDSHIRAMQSGAHLVDIASTEHHTVKPWFSGQIDFAPPVKDLESLGYPLRGGRVDVIASRNVAVLVYQAGRHTIDVFIQPRASQVSAPSELRGFNLRHFDAGEFGVWAVSDLNAHELDTFVERWKAAQ